MSDFPFGFGKPSGEGGDEPERRGENPADNPFAAMFGQGGGSPADFGAALQQIGRMMQWQGGPVNWDLAEQVARQAVSASGDRSVVDAQRATVAEAVKLADHWLDEATTLPSGVSSATAWSRAEWVDATLPVWRQLCDPVAAHVVEAMGQVLPAEAQQMAGPLMGMMRQMGGAMFGAQVGQAIGSLAQEVVGSADVGVPVGPPGQAALVPANVEAFGTGLGVPEEEVRLFLALREAAHHRLFGHVPWLRAHVLAMVEDYARGIRVDTSALEEAVGSIDPANPESLQEALSGDLFAPQETPEQKAALLRLETVLALVEGWVDEVVGEAAGSRLPATSALRETVRRRRAAGGPAEQTFASLVGLELRPRRLRDAAALWRALSESRGVEGRDAVWGHPDLLPTADDLDDPSGFASRSGTLDLSALEASADAGDAPAEPSAEERRADRDEPGEGDGGERPGSGPGTPA
ncbi:MAG: zinc-dependent metalloprotease [Actinomycetes bacterium]